MQVERVERGFAVTIRFKNKPSQPVIGQSQRKKCMNVWGRLGLDVAPLFEAFENAL